VVNEVGRCPSCKAVSAKVHDRYVRRPFDLPWRGRTVRLSLTVRRFRCLNSACKRATFAEDCGPDLPRYARRTLDATSHLLGLAQIAGGEPGARIATSEGLSISPDTLLRLLRHSSPPAPSSVRVVGVDDFALRRRQTYGTILLDLETRRPVDVLEGRDAETLANWLREHPGAEVIARDRSGAYAEGSRTGAPKAIQVADRFHLVQNASAALDGMLRGRRLNIDEAEAAEATPVSTSIVENKELETPAKLSPTKQYLAERRAARVVRWEKVKGLAKAGMGIRQIAREVGISRKTVRHLIDTPLPPRNQVVNPRPGGLSSPTLQPYVTYLQDRWQAGCTNVSQLYREIVARGYPGSRSLLDQALKAWRPPRLSSQQQHRARRMKRRLSMRWICLRPPEQLKPEEKRLLQKLLDQDTDLALGHRLLQEFRRVVADRDVVSLDGWLNQAKSSGLPTFVALANGIEADRAAVDAGLKLPWSNGPTEGHINRLKLIKRQGYGRAKLDLLRARVLAA
jgi:transposase